MPVGNPKPQTVATRKYRAENWLGVKKLQAEKRRCRGIQRRM